MKFLAFLGAMACVCMPLPAHAQTAVDVRAPSGYAPVQAPCVQQVNGTCVPVSAGIPLPTSSSQEAPYAASTPMTVGSTYAPGRGWRAVCTASGIASLLLAGGSTEAVALNVGLTILPYAVTQVATSGTTATCSYANLN